MQKQVSLVYGEYEKVIIFQNRVKRLIKKISLLSSIHCEFDSVLVRKKCHVVNNMSDLLSSLQKQRGRFIYCEIPVSMVRTGHVKGYILGSGKTAGEVYIQSKLSRQSLIKYYQERNPKSLEEYLEMILSADKEVPIYAAPLPWEGFSYSDLPKKKTSLINDNINNGVSGKGVTDWAWVGPVSDEKIDSEKRRFDGIYRSVSQEGFNPRYQIDGFVEGVFLYERNTLAFHPTRGGHRLQVIASMGFDRVIVRVDRKRKHVITERTVLDNNSINELYTEDEALSLFKNIVRGVC